MATGRARGPLPKGRRIRALREARGMTQEKLARMAGIDIKTIYRAEQSGGAMRAETLLDLATALEVPLDEIVEAGDPDAPRDGDAGRTEGPGNLILRRVERASDYYRLAERCERYSWDFYVDPDETTANLISELMQITRRAVLGAAEAADELDAGGEFSEPLRVARLRSVLEALADAGVSVLANHVLAFAEDADGNRAPSAVVLRVVFDRGDVRRRNEYANLQEGRAMASAGDRGSRVIEGIGGLDFRERGSSVIGALALVLETIGEPMPYQELMGASGAAFRFQMAQPRWCPSAPYAGVGFDVIPYAAAAIGRSIEWIQPDPAAEDPMAPRTRAVVESIDRGVPLLYGAEECGIVVGYHQGGRHFSLRTYFDESELYTLLDQWSWPAPGVIGEPGERPDRLTNLRRALELASRIANSETRYPMRDERHYVVGFDALESWVRDLRNDALYEALESESGLVQANRWCFTSLLDARRAAASYLASFDGELSGEAASALSRAAGRYVEVAKKLAQGLPHVPEARATLEPDLVEVSHTRPDGDQWSAERRHGQADTLDAVLKLEREAIAELERCLPLIEETC